MSEVTMSITTVQEVFEYEDSENYDEKKVFQPSKIGTDYNFKRVIVWESVLGFALLHLAGFYGAYLAFTEIKWSTVLYFWVLHHSIGVGVTAGAHRLYSHRAFKAKLPFKLLLFLLQTMSGQYCMYIWARYHRQHHKYSDTDADTHNSNRGFFFSHIGWLMSRKHPLVIEKGKAIDTSDLEADPLIMFQKKYYYLLYFIFGIVVPVYVPVLCWGESTWNSLFVCYFLRYVTTLHAMCSINSFAHLYGTKPFDKNINPAESPLVSLFSGGEGWHNYHHAFPWDYKASELGASLNLTRLVIDIMAYFGLAYDLKQVSMDMIHSRVKRTGDGTHHIHSATSATSDNNNNNHYSETCEKSCLKKVNSTNLTENILIRR